MIDVSAFASAVLQNAARVTKYTKGHNGSDGECDCIGLISGAFALLGVPFGAYGTNNAKRQFMQEIASVHSVNDLRVGEVVYKSRAKGEAYYDLPSNYANDPDQNDYYHIGCVVSVSPLKIVHCTTVAGGIAYDTTIGKWKWHGKIKGVNYNNTNAGAVTATAANQQVKEENKMSESAIVKYIKSSNGLGANMRAAMSTASTLIVVVPENSAVSVLKPGAEWTKVSYTGHEGFVLTRLLSTVQPAAAASMEAAGAVDQNQLYNDFIPAVTSADGDVVTLMIDRKTAEAMYGYLGSVLGGSAVFHG